MIHHGDCLEVLRTLPSESVHCCVTSPPYWGLRDYGHDGQLGLEKSPEEYVARMVDVFREVRRVLRDDGTLWLNIGDSYSGSTMTGGNNGINMDGGESGYKVKRQFDKPKQETGLKPKDLVGIPWRLAFALQSDGWYLRQDIIWHKPNPMPESVRDRCTKAHEYVFLMSKSARYYWDAGAVKEESNGWKIGGAKTRGQTGFAIASGVKKQPQRDSHGGLGGDGDTRNRRSVWTVATQPCKEAHFAVMPQKLVEPCILAGCPERCCSICGMPVEPIVERTRIPTRPGTDTKVTGDSKVDGNRDPLRHVTTTKAIGWKMACDCEGFGVASGTVLDPFFGAGTVGLVATKLGRNYVGIELNPAYIKIAEKRIGQELDRMPLLEAVR